MKEIVNELLLIQSYMKKKTDWRGNPIVSLTTYEDGSGFINCEGNELFDFNNLDDYYKQFALWLLKELNVGKEHLEKVN